MQSWLPLGAEYCRKGILEHESHELSDIENMKVGKVTAFVTARKSSLCCIEVGMLIVCAFGVNQFERAGISGRIGRTRS
jgi:hypothetical protein